MNQAMKAPGTGRLILKYDELLSSFAFRFNLRRYAAAAPPVLCLSLPPADDDSNPPVLEAGAYTRPLLSST